MPEVNFTIFLICIIIFSLLDKGLTYLSLTQIQKNFPDADNLKAEKNPLARYIFSKFGLLAGSIFTFFFTIAWSILFWVIGSKVFGTNQQSVFLYVLFVLYGFTIFNNIYFLMKYSKVIL
jgi:hypothetical protein